MKLSIFITRQIVRRMRLEHPDCTAVDTWAQMQALVEYHGNLLVTLRIMNRN